MLISPEDTAAIWLERAEVSNANVLRSGYFSIGFRPEGARTNFFRALSDFILLTRSPLFPKRDLQKEKNRRAVALLRSWLETDGQKDTEHQATLEHLVKALDEDRLSSRKLFP